jgi:hypothetical protein
MSAKVAASPKRWSGGAAARRNRSDDETGALLILAIVFMTVISVICASLTFWITNDLNNTPKFSLALSLESATNSATQLAVQDIRYDFTAATLNTSPPQPCWVPQAPLAPVSQEEFDNENVAVWCSTQWNPLSSNTRVVTFSTCAEPAFPNSATAATINAAAAACAASPFLQAVVEFDDFPPNLSASNCSPLGNSTCGTTFTVLSWAFGAIIPSITAISATTPTTCSSGEITITGSQLSGATTVNYAITPTFNVVFSSEVLSGGTNSTLSTCAPSQMNVGSTYAISVSTLSGTSATFTYQDGA